MTPPLQLASAQGAEHDESGAEAPLSHESCHAVASVLSLVGDKWSVLIVVTLGDGAMRFTALKRIIGGITQRMLTLTLRDLEREGLVTRTEKESASPHVEYALTGLGESLRHALIPLNAWARDHQYAMRDARRDFDDRHGPATVIRKRRLIA